MIDMNWDQLVTERWFCPDCGCTRKHPYRRVEDDRFHSWRCKTPMVRVRVTMEQI